MRRHSHSHQDRDRDRDRDRDKERDRDRDRNRGRHHRSPPRYGRDEDSHRNRRSPRDDRDSGVQKSRPVVEDFGQRMARMSSAERRAMIAGWGEADEAEK